MTITEQITKNLVEPKKHGPILKALVDILEEEGEKGLKKVSENSNSSFLSKECKHKVTCVSSLLGSHRPVARSHSIGECSRQNRQA